MMLLSFGLVAGEEGKQLVGELTLDWRDPGGEDACGILDIKISEINKSAITAYFSGLGMAVPTVV
jgi:hypothetical protein